MTPDGGVVRFAAAMVADLVAFGREFGAGPGGVRAAEPGRARSPPRRWGCRASASSGARTRPPSSTSIRPPSSGPLAARVGMDLADVRPAGDLVLDPCPPGMQVRLAAPSEPVRFVPYNGPSVLPDWLRRAAGPAPGLPDLGHHDGLAGHRLDAGPAGGDRRGGRPGPRAGAGAASGPARGPDRPARQRPAGPDAAGAAAGAAQLPGGDPPGRRGQHDDGAGGRRRAAGGAAGQRPAFQCRAAGRGGRRA